MKPPRRESTMLFEKVKVDEFINGIIEDITYDQEHAFKGFQGKPDTKQPGVRIKFKLEGYEYPHYSRWMKFSYDDRSNLFKTFLAPLVEGANKDLDFDLDQLKGMKVKTLWSENGEFQNLDTVRPVGKKVKPLNVVNATSSQDLAEVSEDEEAPF